MNPKQKAKELLVSCHYRICNDNGLSQSESTEICAKETVKAICDILIAELLLSTKPDYERVDFWECVKLELGEIRGY